MQESRCWSGSIKLSDCFSSATMVAPARSLAETRRRDSRPSASVHPKRRTALKSTFRATQLTEEQVTVVLNDPDGVFLFRQLAGFIDMKAERLKPYFQSAGILPQRVSVKGFPVTTAEVLGELIPYLDSADPSYKLIDFVHFARCAVGLPAYQKPPRPAE